MKIGGFSANATVSTPRNSKDVETPERTEPEHVSGGFCWCQPLVETDPVTGGHLFIHRRSLDSPHIERTEP